MANLHPKVVIQTQVKRYESWFYKISEVSFRKPHITKMFTKVRRLVWLNLSILFVLKYVVRAKKELLGS